MIRSRWGIGRLVTAFARIFIRIWVRADVSKAKSFAGNAFPVSQDTPVCYVLPSNSLFDALVLDEICAKQHYPRPVALSGGNPTLIYLQKQDRLIHLNQLLTSVRQGRYSDISLVPVSVFWGRAPDKEYSLWKAIFSPSWSMPNALKKLMIVLIHGRDTLVQFSEPLSIKEFLQHETDPKRTQRKLFRMLRVHFRRQKEAALGPDLSHRRTLLNEILHSPRITQAIAQTAATSTLPAYKVQQKARLYLEEIAADYSYPNVRAFYLFFDWFWNKLYSGIIDYNLDKLKTAAALYEIVYVPCHRSYLDSMVISYVALTKGVASPHIVTGANLLMPLLGTGLRRGGGIFIRRKLKDNPLYNTVFHEYLHCVLAKGFSIEFFVEGTRSRSGRLLPPQYGMLSMILKSYILDSKKPIAFMPVNVAYEKSFESNSYVKELQGKKKKPERFSDLVKSVRKLRNRFGKVYINFGEPILLDELLSQHHEQWKNASPEETATARWLRNCVSELGHTIMSGINQAAVVHPISLTSLVLLATARHALDHESLEAQLAWYLQLLKELPYSENIAIAETSVEKIIRHCEASGMILRMQHMLGDIICLDESNAVLLTYCKNNILHTLAMPALVVSYILHEERTTEAALEAFIQGLYPFLKAELTLYWTPEAVIEHTRQLIALLVRDDLITQTGDTLEKPHSGGKAHFQLNLLASTMRHTIERYYISLALLFKTQNQAVTKEHLEEQCMLSAQRIAVLFEFSAPEFFDKRLFSTFLDTLTSQKLIYWEEERLKLSEQIETLYQQVRSVLGEDIRHLIKQTTIHGADREALYHE